jgi:hypothetical protein
MKLQERLLEMRQGLLRLERNWMSQANFEDRAGRPELAELIRNHIDEIQAIRKGQPLPDEPDQWMSVSDMKWEGKLR